MARSSHFEPDTVAPAQVDRDVARHDKQEVTARPASHGESDVHYGRRFAETEAILKARAEERAAAGEHEPAEAPDMHLGSTEGQVTPSPGPPATGAVASEAGMPGMAHKSASREGRGRQRRRGASSAPRSESPPLGAMPSEELPPGAEQALAETPAELLGAYRDQVTRSVRGLGDAARQLRAAAREVLGLPFEALRVGVRIGRSFLGRSPRRA
jgi:hypothetical protein